MHAERVQLPQNGNGTDIICFAHRIVATTPSIKAMANIMPGWVTNPVLCFKIFIKITFSILYVPSLQPAI